MIHKEEFLKMFNEFLKYGTIYISVYNVKEYYEDERRTKVTVSINIGDEQYNHEFER